MNTRPSREALILDATVGALICFVSWGCGWTLPYMLFEGASWQFRADVGLAVAIGFIVGYRGALRTTRGQQ